MSDQTPSIGRIVHYVSYGTPGGEHKSECRAAIITEADPNSTVVGLFVANPTGLFLNRDVHYDEGGVAQDHTGAEIPARSYEGGTWHWPERV